MEGDWWVKGAVPIKCCHIGWLVKMLSVFEGTSGWTSKKAVGWLIGWLVYSLMNIRTKNSMSECVSGKNERMNE